MINDFPTQYNLQCNVEAQNLKFNNSVVPKIALQTLTPKNL